MGHLTRENTNCGRVNKKGMSGRKKGCPDTMGSKLSAGQILIPDLTNLSMTTKFQSGIREWVTIIGQKTAIKQTNWKNAICPFSIDPLCGLCWTIRVKKIASDMAKIQQPQTSWCFYLGLVSVLSYAGLCLILASFYGVLLHGHAVLEKLLVVFLDNHYDGWHTLQFEQLSNRFC